MSKDMLGPLPRALVGVPIEYHGTLRDAVNRLGDKDVAKAAHFARDLKRLLRGEIDMGPPPKFTLHLFGKQKEGGYEKGTVIDAHLKETKLIERCLSLEDEVVKDWLADPSTYPEEFKEKAVFLWKSERGFGGDRGVAYLIWIGGRVVGRWLWLGDGWDGATPVLLAQ